MSSPLTVAMPTSLPTLSVKREAGQALAESLASAAVVVARVLDGESLTRAMSDVRATGAKRAAVQDLAYSTLRDYGRSNALLEALVPRQPASGLRGLLMAALVELERGLQSEHAVVHQAVEAAGRIAPKGGAKAKGLVNAVLRNFLRQRSSLVAAASMTETWRYQHPLWWIERVRAAWPQYWERTLAAGNQVPGMTLRVNARRMDARVYAQRLSSRGIQSLQLDSHAIRLDKPVPVEKLPGFLDGEVSVQDWGAQQAAPLLKVQPGMRVLDACAAPGGKAAHIAELVDCDLTAADVDAARLERVSANLRRLGLAARIMLADARHPCSFGAGQYDRILADVPCSASGVVRRHPDIKWLRRDNDIPAFAATQRAMLDSLWQLLTPGGRFLYATCSVFPEENDLQVDGFLDRHSDALRLQLPELPPLMAGAQQSGQILPNEYSDGFFYALLEKRC